MAAERTPGGEPGNEVPGIAAPSARRDRQHPAASGPDTTTPAYGTPLPEAAGVATADAIGDDGRVLSSRIDQPVGLDAEHGTASGHGKRGHRRRAVRALDALPQLLLPGLPLLRTRYRAWGIVGVTVAAFGWLVILTALGLALVNRRQLIQLGLDETTLNLLVAGAVIWGASAVLMGIIAAVSAGRHRRWIAVVLIAAVAIVPIGLAGLATNDLLALRGVVGNVFEVDGGQAAGGGQPEAVPVPEQGRVNILLLGGDAGEGRTGLRPDSISVLSTDLDTGDTVVIGIPRNLEQVPLPEDAALRQLYPNGYDCGDDCLIDYLYTVAHQHPDLFTDAKYRGRDIGVETMREAASEVIGQPIQYSVLVDMQSFASLVDAVGGIEVDVPKRTVAQDNKTVYEAGRQHMTGAQALLYARTRYDSNDYGRMEKQRLVQQALLEQADPATLLREFQSIAQTGSKYVRTTVPKELVPDLMDTVEKARGQGGFEPVELVPPKVNVVDPDYDEIHATVKQAIGQ